MVRLAVLVLVAWCSACENADGAGQISEAGPVRLVGAANDAWEDSGHSLPTYAARLERSVTADGRMGFIHIADVAVNSEGVVAVLDRRELRVFLFTDNWEPLGSFGRGGDGPGEFRDPVALEALGSKWLVFDRAHIRLSVFTGTGIHLITKRVAATGDLPFVAYRQPTFGFYAPFPGNNDLSERLRVLTDEHFVMAVEDSEWERTVEKDTAERKTRIVRYSSDLVVVDTVYVGAAPRLVIGAPSTGAGVVARGPAVFSPRLVWSASPGSPVVVSDGGAAVQTVSDSAETVLLTRLRERPVREDDKRHVLEWSVQRWSPFWRTRSRSRSSRRSYVSANIPHYEFATVAPAITALHIVGRDIWVAGFEPGAGPQAISHQWLVYRLNATPEAIGWVRIGGLGVKIAALVPCRIYAVAQDDIGVPSVEVYSVPAPACVHNEQSAA